MSPRVLYPRFGETAGKASGVDWLFGLDEADPWVKTYVVVHCPRTTICLGGYSLSPYSWRANSNVVRYQLHPSALGVVRLYRLSDRSQVFHASYVLQVVSKRVDQALVPMRNFIVGSAGLQTRRLSPDDVSEPKQDELAIRPSPPAKTPGLSAPLDAQKLSGRVSLLRSPARDSSAEKAPYMRRSSRADAPTSIELANQSTLVDSLAPHDNSEQLKQDPTPVPFPQAPSVPTITTTAPLYQDCPRIDLVALVREKQKAKMLQRKKLSALPSPKEPQCRVILQDSSSKKTR